MAKKNSDKRLMFAMEEVVLSFIGALVLTFGIMLLSNALGTDGFWSVFVLVIFVVWLGLLLFMVPIVRKIEQLM
ncbi:MAG: hypothetical protein R6U26_03220 [Candidatus Undinarchaeales archaeon]